MRVSLQAIADKLLEDGLLLTALEFHTELLESGKELKSLKEFFSDSQNFSSGTESQSRSGPEISRSESQVTLDSIDRLTRYSEDTDRREDDRLAILEYELRTARETIAQLRTELQELTKNDKGKASQGNSSEEEKEEDEEELQIKPHEKKFLNYLVNDYLMINGYKFTAVTFSDECDEQNFDDWEEVSSYSVGNPTILSIYRNSGYKAMNDKSKSADAEGQTSPVRILEETEWTDLTTELERVRAERENLLHQAESQARTNSQLQEELHTKIEENEAVTDSLRSQILELETERQTLTDKVRDLTKLTSQTTQRPPAEPDMTTGRPPHEREDGDGASVIDEPIVSPSGCGDLTGEQRVTLPKSLDQFVFQSYSEIPRPFSESFQKTFLKKVFPISIDESLLDHTDISDVLASTLPKLISNLVLSSRIDIVPLLLYSISCQKDVRSRESLIGVLFNLMKKPDQTTRQTVLQGLLWLVHQPGWDSKRVEEELLPQCLEQLNQKYNEKKIMVGQSIAVLAAYIHRTIRSSLLISMVLQLLNDKDPEVVITGIRSLAVLINLLEDEDKTEQVYNVIVLILNNPDTPDDIIQEIQTSIMPVINVWLMKIGKTFRLVDGLLTEIEKNSVLESFTSLDDTAAVDEVIESKESLVLKLSLISGQMRSIVLSVIHSRPGVAGVENNSEHETFSTFLSQEWFKPWPLYEQFLEFLSRLSNVFQKVPTQDVTLIDCCSKLLSFIMELTGSQFSEEKVFPLIESRLGSGNAALSIFCISLTRDNSPFQSKAMSLMKSWTARLAGADTDCSLLFPFISFLCKEGKEVLAIESLRELVADPSPRVRIEVGGLLCRLVRAGSELSSPRSGPAVSRMLVPAVLSLTSDLQQEVRTASAPALVSLLAINCLDWEVSLSLVTGCRILTWNVLTRRRRGCACR